MSERRKFLTYPYVVSTLALAVACSGGAYAAGLAKNSVTSKQIAPNAVHTTDLGKDAATGDKVKESTLAKVPSAINADKLGGQAATAFLGAERVLSGRALQAIGIEDVVFQWPEAGWKLVGDGNGTFTGWGVKIVATRAPGPLADINVYDLSNGGSADVAFPGSPFPASAAQFVIVDRSERTRFTYVTCAQSGDAPVYAYCTGIRSK